MSASSKRTNTPRLSIVMPFFNKKELVAEMIDSILANDFQEWELLAIDDGSTQETWNYLNHLYKDDRIKFIHRNREPKGAQTCRNTGLELAAGEFLVFFDSDDIITTSCLGERVRYIEGRNDLDFAVFPSGTVIDGKYDAYDNLFVYGYPIYTSDIIAYARRELPFIVWNNIYRTASLRNHHITWDEALKSMQDADFNVHNLLIGLRYEYAFNTPDYGYRIAYSKENISSKIISKEHQNSHLHSIRKIYNSFHIKYGNRYDFDLYLGILRLYNAFFTNGIDKHFSFEIARTIRSFSTFYGVLLLIHIYITLLLEKCTSTKKARQIPMFAFLLYDRSQQRKRAERIIQIRKEHAEYTTK